MDVTDLDRLLDFAARSWLPEGGFGYLGADGQVLPDRGQETWIVARMTHVFGLAQLTGRSGWDELVRRGVEALAAGLLRDDARGGWYASTTDDTKAAYVHAFAVLAGATVTAAGAPGGRELLDEALGITPGAVTPFALINDESGRVNVVLDSAMLRQPLLNYHPLVNTATTTIRADDLVRFVRATGHEPRVLDVSSSS